jgi:hypothetical protein
MTRRLRHPRLEAVGFTGESSAISDGLASLRYAIRLHDDLRDQGVTVPNAATFDLARPFTTPIGGSHVRVAGLFRLLFQQHKAVKGDEVWIRGGARAELEISRDVGDSWSVPDRVRPHSYRMTAFDQVASDLGGL